MLYAMTVSLNYILCVYVRLPTLFYNIVYLYVGCFALPSYHFKTASSCHVIEHSFTYIWKCYSYHASFQKTIRQPMMMSIVACVFYTPHLCGGSGRIWSHFQHKNSQKPLNHRILYIDASLPQRCRILYPFETGATGAYTSSYTL